MGVAITNGWLIYPRYCDQKKISNLCTFQSGKAKALLLGKKEKQTPKRGRLSTITNDEAVCKKQNIVTNPIPVNNVHYHRVGHFPVFLDKKSVANIALV